MEVSAEGEDGRDDEEKKVSDKRKRKINSVNGKWKLRISFPYVMKLPQRGLYRECTEINKSWNESSKKKLSMPETYN